MSILVGKLALFTIVPVVGAGVVYPMVASLRGGEKQISFSQMKDFETNCWVSLQGESEESDGFNKKLLACFVTENSKNAKFYFYERTSEVNTLPEVITKVTRKGGGGEYETAEFTLTLSDDREENIKTTNPAWYPAFNNGLPWKCQIVTNYDSSGDMIRKLKCGETKYRPELEKFDSQK